MAKLKDGAWLAPFWGKKGYSTGRDPLGMQVASIGTYAILLPGLTNLTRRVRYYSFYCWIIERYAKDESHTDYNIFRQFIRRAELQFAYGMTICFPKSPAVVGSEWAARHLKSFGDNIPDDFEVDLAGGADQNGGSTYWKYSLGAFGQYFLGSLLQLGLVREREGSPGVYLCTDIGRQLGASFNTCFSDAVADIFIASVKSGKAKVKNLKAILPAISLDSIVSNSDEWNLLVSLLMGPDDGGQSESPTYFRKNTIENYLSFLSILTEEDELKFSRSNYKNVLTNGIMQTTDIQSGWFIYELNEIAHFSFGSVFWGFLEILREKAHPIPYRSLERELTENLAQSLHEISEGNLSKNSLTNEVVQYLIKSDITEEQLEEKIANAIEEGNSVSGMAYGVLLAFKLYIRVNAFNVHLAEYAHKYGMAREGDFSDLISFLETVQNKTIDEMTSILLRKNIVNRHIEESIRKMGGGIRNTLKFRNEDGRLFHIQTVWPQWTQPRLISLKQFLLDLKMLDSEDSVTSLGTTIMKGTA